MIREEKEIYQQIYEANNYIIQGNSKYPGLTYEDGVKFALEWVLGDNNIKPMED